MLQLPGEGQQRLERRTGTQDVEVVDDQHGRPVEGASTLDGAVYGAGAAVLIAETQP